MLCVTGVATGNVSRYDFIDRSEYLNLKYFLHFYSMGSAITSLVLHYGKDGDPLSMWMEEDGLVSKADIPTQEVKETLFFDFSKPKVCAKVVMLCEHLR